MPHSPTGQSPGLLHTGLERQAVGTERTGRLGDTHTQPAKTNPITLYCLRKNF